MNKFDTLKLVTSSEVKITGDFWKRYLNLIKDVALPYQWDALNDNVPNAEASYAIKNFCITAGLESGEFFGTVFQDSELAKWIEAASYIIGIFHDKDLEQKVDYIIEIIEKAQQTDGYLNTYFTLKEPDKRWSNLCECHELYSAGHMIEAGVAYYKATGKRKLFDVVCRMADYIDTIFGPEAGKIKGYPGHQEIELALIKLYRETKNDRYLNLAKYFIDERGREPYYFDIELERVDKFGDFGNLRNFGRRYSQTHMPVREQTTAEGHAVRALYMYSGILDVAVETGDESLYNACKKIWGNIVNKKMFITGAVGSTSYGESFTFDYDLPNDTAYNESCASVALIQFAHRMQSMEINSTYADVIERALYNTVISGISLDGKSFFYVNPLEVLPEACEKDNSKKHVKPIRQKWFPCACCPPNIARLIASLGEYIFSIKENTIYTHLYISAETNIEMDGYNVKLIQNTEYPYDGKVKLEVFTEGLREFQVALRIPGWCKDFKVRINGELINLEKCMDRGYLFINRLWSVHDNIEIYMDMPVMRVKANPMVREDIGKIALQRGPVVYCMEQIDNGANLHQLSLPRDCDFTIEDYDKILNGIIGISANAERITTENWSDELYKSNVKDYKIIDRVKFIPYYTWANRGIGEMQVWIRES